MTAKYAYGKLAIGECDVCSRTYRLHQLKETVQKGVPTGILACPTCWDKDHPQLFLGERPINDPQALRNPRPDTSSLASSRTIMVNANQVAAQAATGGVLVTT